MKLILILAGILKRRILTTVGFNWTTLGATQPTLHLMFRNLFLKIALSAAELILFGHLGAVIWQRWTIICGVPPKISVMPRSQSTIYALKDNIREAIGGIQLHTVNTAWPAESAIWMKLFSIINRKVCTFKSKKKFEKIFSRFFKAFSKKKNYLAGNCEFWQLMTVIFLKPHMSKLLSYLQFVQFEFKSTCE